MSNIIVEIPAESLKHINEHMGTNGKYIHRIGTIHASIKNTLDSIIRLISYRIEENRAGNK